jgi:hypothetical protein
MDVLAPDPISRETAQCTEHDGPQHDRDDRCDDEYFNHDFPKSSATGAPRAQCARRGPAAGVDAADAAPGHWPGGVSSMSVPPD